MKKTLSLCLLFAILFAMMSAACAQAQLCPQCSQPAEGSFCAQCGTALPIATESGNCLLTLKVTMEENLFIFKYDVDVLLNDALVAEIPHGGKLEQAFPVALGDVNLTFRSKNDASALGTLVFHLEGDATLQCTITAKHDEVEIEDVQTTASLADTRLPMGTAAAITHATVTLQDVQYLPLAKTDSQAALCTFSIANNTSGKHNYLLTFTGRITLQDGTVWNSAHALENVTQWRGSLNAWSQNVDSVFFALPAQWAEVEVTCSYGLMQAEHVTFVFTRP